MTRMPLVAPDAGANADAAGATARKKPTPPPPPAVVPLPDDASVAGEEDPGAALDDSGVAPPTLPKPEP